MLKVFDRCRNLKNVNISGCIAVSDDALIALANKCIKIESLELSGLFKIR
jgi:hypothetical protein